MALRLYARVHFGQSRGGGLGIDDYITLVCWLVFLISIIFASIAYSYGLGSHYTTLDPVDAIQAQRWNVITNTVLIWQFSLPKFAIVAITGRILNWGTKTAAMFWTMAILSQAGIFATSIVWVHQCDPPEFQWNKAIPGGGSCISPNVLSGLGMFTSAYSAFLDIFFALYPVPTIMKLHMPLKKRVAVASALGASGLGAIVGVYKICIMGGILAMIPKDPTFPTPALFCITLAEGTLNIICASLPALGPLMNPIKEKVYSLSQRSGTNGTESQSKAGVSSNGSSWQKLDDTAAGSASRGGKNVDDIPLVDKVDPQSRIFKTMEVAVNSEYGGR